MSDSDSGDDELLSKTVFGNARKSRAKEKEKRKQEQRVNDVLNDSEKHVEARARVNTLKKEDSLRSSAHGSVDPLSLEDTFSSEKSTQKRKRDLFRQGFFEVSSDDELDDSPAGKKLRQDMLTKLRDEQTSSIGVRNTISFDPERGMDRVKFFSSKENAVEELKNMLDLKPLRRAIEADVLSELLSSKRLLNIIDQQECNDGHIEIVAHWLLSVVQSAGLGTADCYSLVQGAMETLLGLLQEKKLNAAAFFSNMEVFLSTLECWVYPWSDEGEQASSGDKREEESRNLGGLVNSLSIWLQAIPLLNSPQVRMETWSKCLAALMRIGMDTSGTSNSESFNVVPTVEKVCSALIDLAAKRVGDPAELSTWIQEAASEICRGLGKLGPGPPDSEDATDVNGWLYYATLARLIPSGSRTACELKVAVALQALEAMHDSSISIDENASLLFSEETCQRILDLSKRSVWVKALLTAYISLSKLEIGQDESAFARCYSVAECSFVVMQTSFELLKYQESGQAPSKAGVFGSSENAACVCGVFSLLGKEIDRLLSVSNRMTGDSHMRRFAYLLNLFNQFRRRTMTQLGKFDPWAKRDTIQKDLSHFFSRS